MNNTIAVYNYLESFKQAHSICKSCLEHKPKSIHYSGFTMAGKLLSFNGICDVCSSHTKITIVKEIGK